MTGEQAAVSRSEGRVVDGRSVGRSASRGSGFWAPVAGLELFPETSYRRASRNSFRKRPKTRYLTRYLASREPPCDAAVELPAVDFPRLDSLGHPDPEHVRGQPVA